MHSTICLNFTITTAKSAERIGMTLHSGDRITHQRRSESQAFSWRRQISQSDQRWLNMGGNSIALKLVGSIVKLCDNRWREQRKRYAQYDLLEFHCYDRQKHAEDQNDSAFVG